MNLWSHYAFSYDINSGVTIQDGENIETIVPSNSCQPPPDVTFTNSQFVRMKGFLEFN